MDYFIKDAYSSAQVWGYVYPSVFIFALLLWSCGPCNFWLSCIYTFSFLHMPSPDFPVSTTRSVLRITAQHPLASKKPRRPRLTPLHPDSFSHFSLSVTEGSARSGYLGFLFVSAAPSRLSPPAGQPWLPFLFTQQPQPPLGPAS